METINRIIWKAKNYLCSSGIHNWRYYGYYYKRECADCNKSQYWDNYNKIWVTAFLD